ncbi:Para-nitrobenzyl esterase, putative, partial [Ricinus communis]
MKKAGLLLLSSSLLALSAHAAPRATTATGAVEGVTEASGVTSYKGIPYAAAPVGKLRWQAPQPAAKWQGVRKADHFGARCMQLPLFSDMVFRSDGVSEDCLFLNVWTPAKSAKEKLPVLVYFYGGGFAAGDGSEPRYDGESMAAKGIVTLTVNYRLNVFGFLAHPELTKESPHHASGNYGLMDQAAALQWVKKNIAAFGGDPSRVTIAGESAGSFSVSAQMINPQAKGLIAGAIGESGSLLGLMAPAPLAAAEQAGAAFAQGIGAPALKELRALPADKLLENLKKPGAWFFAIQDGYVIPKPPVAMYAAGEQAGCRCWRAGL